MSKNPALKLPKVSLSYFRQVFFVFKEVIRIAWKVNPRLIASDLILNSLWGLTSLPTLYLGKLVIDAVIHGISAQDKTTAIGNIAFYLFLTALVGLVRRIITRTLSVIESNISSRMTAKVDVLLGEKMSQFDIPTIKNPEF